MGDLSFDLPTVKMATGDFSQSHVIGEGGFAVVYKVLQNSNMTSFIHNSSIIHAVNEVVSELGSQLM
jgi:hypothetical protein